MAERVRRTKRPTLKAPVGAPGRGLSGVIVLPVWDGDLMATSKSGRQTLSRAPWPASSFQLALLLRSLLDARIANTGR